MNTDRRTRAAVHEVGHAMMFYSRVPDQEFSISMEGDKKAIARFIPDQTNDDLKKTPLTQEHVQRVLWVAVGGEAAEFLIYGNTDGLMQRLDHWTFARYAGIYFEILEHPEYIVKPTNLYEVEVSANAVDIVHEQFFTNTVAAMKHIRSEIEIAVKFLIEQGNLTRADLNRIMQK